MIVGMPVVTFSLINTTSAIDTVSCKATFIRTAVWLFSLMLMNYRHVHSQCVHKRFESVNVFSVKGVLIVEEFG